MFSADWPLFDLRIRTPRLELRPDDDPGLGELAALAAEGIHDPAVMPFSQPWTDAPGPELRRGTLQWHWGQRASFSPGHWWCCFLAYADGAVVGTQSLYATDFAVLGAVESGSWLGLAHQGHGLGTEMRAGVLHLAFAHLGAVEARSAAFEDNTASLRVSEKLGYVADRRRRVVRRGEPAVLVELGLSRARWAAHRPAMAVEVSGVEDCLAMFGAPHRARTGPEDAGGP